MSVICDVDTMPEPDAAFYLVEASKAAGQFVVSLVGVATKRGGDNDLGIALRVRYHDEPMTPKPNAELPSDTACLDAAGA